MTSPKKTTLLLGYGNVDRQDDGLAWHILQKVAGNYALSFVDPYEEIQNEDGKPHFLFQLQLVPEISELVAGYERVCFIDTHTGRIPEEVKLTNLQPGFQNSPFTHHMTPETILELASTLYGKRPEAILVSARGIEFGFSQSLSPQAAKNVDLAVELILKWLNDGGIL